MLGGGAIRRHSMINPIGNGESALIVRTKLNQLIDRNNRLVLKRDVFHGYDMITLSATPVGDVVYYLNGLVTDLLDIHDYKQFDDIIHAVYITYAP
jgi:hypothetical protein